MKQVSQWIVLGVKSVISQILKGIVMIVVMFSLEIFLMFLFCIVFGSKVVVLVKFVIVSNSMMFVILRNKNLIGVKIILVLKLVKLWMMFVIVMVKINYFSLLVVKVWLMRLGINIGVLVVCVGVRFGLVVFDIQFQ